MRTAALFLYGLLMCGVLVQPPKRPIVCIDLTGPAGEWRILSGDKDAYLTHKPSLCIARYGHYRLEINTGSKRLEVAVPATLENVLKWYRQHAKTYPVL